MRLPAACCCARAANGQEADDAAAPLSNVMNSRRLIDHLAGGEEMPVK
jgi:hypothetical protein